MWCGWVDYSVCKLLRSLPGVIWRGAVERKRREEHSMTREIWRCRRSREASTHAMLLQMIEMRENSSENRTVFIIIEWVNYWWDGWFLTSHLSLSLLLHFQLLLFSSPESLMIMTVINKSGLIMLLKGGKSEEREKGWTLLTPTHDNHHQRAEQFIRWDELAVFYWIVRWAWMKDMMISRDIMFKIECKWLALDLIEFV